MNQETNKTLLSDPSIILNETENIIKEYHDNFNKLVEKSFEYVKKYDEYIDIALPDASRIKEQLKEAIIMAGKNEL